MKARPEHHCDCPYCPGLTRGNRPQPLDPDEVEEFKADWLGLLVYVDGKPYNREDLWTCMTCRKPQLVETDEHGDCEECAEGHRLNDL